VLTLGLRVALGLSEPIEGRISIWPPSIKSAFGFTPSALAVEFFTVKLGPAHAVGQGRCDPF